MPCEVCHQLDCTAEYPDFRGFKPNYLAERRKGLPIRDACHAVGWKRGTADIYRSICAAFRTADDTAWEDWRLSLVRKRTDLNEMSVAQAQQLLARFWDDWRDPAIRVAADISIALDDDDRFEDYEPPADAG